MSLPPAVIQATAYLFGSGFALFVGIGLILLTLLCYGLLNS